MTLIEVQALNWLNEVTKGMDGCLVVGHESCGRARKIIQVS